MADCKECYRYNICLIENTSIAIMASKQGMKSSCYKFIHKDIYDTRTPQKEKKGNNNDR